LTEGRTYGRSWSSLSGRDVELDVSGNFLCHGKSLLVFRQRGEGSIARAERREYL